jgi:hypothetical protein
MTKDRYTPNLSGHSAPWSRRPAAASGLAAAPVSSASHAPARPSPASNHRRWPWVLLAAVIVAVVGWLVYDVAVS